MEITSSADRRRSPSLHPASALVRRALAAALIVACWLSLGGGPRLIAYYDDVHYVFTFFLARQVGYTALQAFRVASACLTIDYDSDTEPVQGLVPTASVQTPRWKFHAFRNEVEYDDPMGGGEDDVASRVAMSAQQRQLWRQAVESDAPNPGVFVHFLQDVVSHGRYGSRWGHMPVTDPDVFALHLSRGLPVGGTPDWVSAGEHPEATFMALVEETHARLARFLTEVSPGQPVRPFNPREYVQVVRELVRGNPAPPPLDSEFRRQLFARYYLDTHLLAGGILRPTKSRSPLTDVARLHAELQGRRDPDLEKHAVGPKAGPAFAAAGAALAAQGLESVPSFPFEYEFDEDGDLDNRYMTDDWTITGSLVVQLYDQIGDDPEPPEQGAVTIRLARQRPGDQEAALTDARPVRLLRTGRSGQQLVGTLTFDRLPVGDLIIEVTGAGNKVLARREVKLDRRRAEHRVDVLRTLKRVLRGHEDWVQTVAVSPDSRTIASGGHDTRVLLWDLQTGERKADLARHAEYVTGVAFTPDGKTLVSSDAKGTLILWDVESATPTARRVLQHPPGYGVWSFDLSPDGSTLATACGGDDVVLWDLRTGTQSGLLSHRGTGARVARFSPDGRRLATAGSGAVVRIWNLETKSVEHAMPGHRGIVHSLAFAPNGRTVASGSQLTGFRSAMGFFGEVKVWDVETGQLARDLPIHGHGVFALGFSPDGKTLAARSVDGKNQDEILLWDTLTWSVADRLLGPDGTTRALAFSADGRAIVTGVSDRTVRVWPFERGGEEAGPARRAAPGTGGAGAGAGNAPGQPAGRSGPPTPAGPPTTVDELADPFRSMIRQGQSEDASRSAVLTALGVELGLGPRGMVFTSIADGSPASSFGIAVGDALVAVNGRETQGLSVADVVALLRAPAGGSLALTIAQARTGQRATVTINVKAPR